LKRRKGISFGLKLSYCLVALGVTAIIVLHLVGIIPVIEYSLIYLILILVALLIFPTVSEFTIANALGSVSVKSSILPTKENDDENSDNEINQELKGALSKISAKDVRAQILQSYCMNNGIKGKRIQENCQIISSGDKIGSVNPVFSWYYKDGVKEFFCEPKFTSVNIAFYNKLYVMLSKIFVYNEQNENRLKLVLLVVIKTEKREFGVSSEELESLEDCFDDSINNGILEIKKIEI
jgi:hypothetical protein